jgi:alpha/beta superfamily hydrolase
MSNNIVFAICQALAGQAIAALRFNFRGVGHSTGAYSEGTGEQADVGAALDFVAAAPGVDRDRIGLAGYSFGAGVIAPVASRDIRVGLLAMVSPYLTTGNWALLRSYARPKLIISGAADDVIPPEQLRREVTGMAEPLELMIVPGADHFWAGFVGEAARKVTGFFTAGFRQS